MESYSRILRSNGLHTKLCQIPSFSENPSLPLGVEGRRMSTVPPQRNFILDKELGNTREDGDRPLPYGREFHPQCLNRSFPAVRNSDKSRDMFGEDSTNSSVKYLSTVLERFVTGVYSVSFGENRRGNHRRRPQSQGDEFADRGSDDP